MTLQQEAASVGTLLRGEVTALVEWTSHWKVRRLTRDLMLIVLGGGVFAATVGSWRDPLQALYAGIKFPLIIVLTALGNTLINALVAPLLGLRIRLRQALLSILASFALACAILGAFSPLTLFVIWNAPPLVEGANNSSTHGAILLLLVSVIAFAGIAANLRLLQLLRRFAGTGAAAWRVLFAWLAANLFLGSQLSWVLRPFVGAPGLPVQFLREDAFDGNFYEAVFHSAIRFFN